MYSDLFFDAGSVGSARFAFVLWTARPEKMKELSHMCIGVEAFPARSATLSQRSLWCAVTRPPFLQLGARHTEKALLHPSQNLGRYGVYRPYHRKRASHHSCVPSYVLFSVDRCTISHAPVFVVRLKRHETWTREPSRVSSSASYDRNTVLFLTYTLPYIMYAEWSSILNFSWPLSTATRCPLITQDALQFSRAVFVGSGRAKTACFIGKRVTPCPRVPSPTPCKKSGANVSRRAIYNGPKASPMYGVIHCTNSHSCWSDFLSLL